VHHASTWIGNGNIAELAMALAIVTKVLPLAVVAHQQFLSLRYDTRVRLSSFPARGVGVGASGVGVAS
jgi:hypothetical protein